MVVDHFDLKLDFNKKYDNLRFQIALEKNRDQPEFDEPKSLRRVS